MPRFPLCLCLAGLLMSAEVPPPFTHFGQTMPLPAVQGVAAVHILSDRWLAIGIDLTPRIVEEVERLSGGTYRASIAAWSKSTSAGRPDWGVRKKLQEARERWWGTARVAAGETALSDPTTWAITSPDDPAYAQPQRALRASALPISLDQGGDDRGTPNVEHGCYGYIELPSPLQSGRTYEIALQGALAGRSCRLRFDLDTTVSRSIKLNQVGYRPQDPLKIAYLGGWIPGVGPLPFADAPTWQLVDATGGAVVASGAWVLRDDAGRCAPNDKERDPAKRPLITGERLYEADFSAVTRPGSYRLRVPGVGRSWPLRIAEDAYGEAWFTTMRGFFHQRGSFALERPYTAWTRKRMHSEPVYESQHIPFGTGGLGAPKGYERFDVIGATLDKTHTTEEVVGGYYDAADWDRNLAHDTIAFDLLALYDRRPTAFPDRQLNIPESGNGIPDLLDEVEFGLRVWLRSQDASGAVSGAVEANSHYAGDDPKGHYAYSRRTRFSTLMFASAAAWYARCVAASAPALSARYLTSARSAFAWGADPAHGLGKIAIPAKRNRGAGAAYEVAWEETPAMSQPYELLARQHLWLATGEESYLDGIAELAANAPKAYEWPWGTKDHSGYFTCLLAPPSPGAAPLSGIPAERLRLLRSRIPAELGRKLADNLLAPARSLAGMLDGMPYRMTWKRDQDFWMSWGADCMFNPNRALWIAETIDPDPAFRRAILANAAAMLGANPLGQTWTTGLGCVYPAVIQHWTSETDGIPDPVPGITVYGINEGAFPALREQVWKQKVTAADGTVREQDFGHPGLPPVWRRWYPHPQLNTAQCEFTVWETMSGAALTAGILVSDGWLPTQAIPEPRPHEHLFGLWYLP